MYINDANGQTLLCTNAILAAFNTYDNTWPGQRIRTPDYEMFLTCDGKKMLFVYS
jgi:hypothetical protein